MNPAPASRPTRPVPSLKAQAIGWLSRREHSRQELRLKLLSALQRRERDALERARLKAAHDAAVARALQDMPPNGIDDAFRPPEPDPDPDPGTRPGYVRAASPHAAQASPDDGEIAPGGQGTIDPADAEAEVDALLDWLQAHGYLSDERFIESRVHARSARQGVLRIRHELARHGLSLDPAQAAELRESEFARARAVWERKFGEVGADARERARQARFLAGRGFSADVVRRLVGGEDGSD